MLYIVGGAGRAGKSIIAHRFMRETETPYLSLDVLMMGIYRGYPERGVNPEDPDYQNAEKMWPVVQSMSRNIVEADLEYLFEGVSILPHQVNELVNTYPKSVRACFIGFPDTTPEEKLRAIHDYPNHPNNWTSGYSDNELMDFIYIQIRHSVRLRDECANFNIPYYNESGDFCGTINSVIRYLKGD